MNEHTCEAEKVSSIPETETDSDGGFVFMPGNPAARMPVRPITKTRYRNTYRCRICWAPMPDEFTPWTSNG